MPRPMRVAIPPAHLWTPEPTLVAPNNDVGLDNMVFNLASLLSGTTTNPFGNGYFQGPKGAPLEAASACLGLYGKGAYPGYGGDLLVDPATGASYNANGANGRKYLVPTLFNPSTQTCSGGMRNEHVDRFLGLFFIVFFIVFFVFFVVSSGAEASGFVTDVGVGQVVQRQQQWCGFLAMVFMCLECSSKHHSLGVHISFVRSVTINSWFEIQIKKMESRGNEQLNLFFAQDLVFN
ncbi:hypothetical protein SO802_032832 [Lithocarpus litseifolius]|uniref:Arf-GAP domain-containing protein n=1 Tax=Lithocarpus litseifolius TaxID=425828 RepID=A0AAW2BBW0_9ROSI